MKTFKQIHIVNKFLLMLVFTLFFLSNSKAQWQLTGNAGTTPPINFIGTTDAKDLLFKTSNIEFMRLSLIGNFGIGTTSPGYKLDVNGDVNIPSSNSYKMDGSNYLSYKGTDNILLGLGTGNGLIAGPSNSTGNIFIGNGAGNSSGYSFNNIFIGHNSGASHNAITFGGANTFLGNSSGANNNSHNNTFIGSSSGYNSTGSDNTYLGANSGNSGGGSYSGKQNTFIGSIAGQTNISGDNNTYLGYNANADPSLTNASAIGANSYVTASNSLVLGNSVNVGIGVSAPLEKLHVVGNARISGLAGGGDVFADANGKLIIGTAPPVNWLLAGNTISSSDFIGSTNSFDLNFKANNQSYMKLTTGGTLQVGNNPFGTGGPSGQLQVWTSSSSANIKSGYFYSGCTTCSEAIGVMAIATAGVTEFTTSSAVGIDGYGDGAGFFTSGSSIGVRGTASYGLSTMGVYGHVDAPGGDYTTTTNNYGVYGSSHYPYGYNYGIYGDAGGGIINYAGYFNGNVLRTGTDNFTSDLKLKENIKELTGMMQKIMLMKPKSYTFKTDEFSQMNLPKGNRFGLIAQDLEKIFPELVSNNIHPAVIDSNGKIIKEKVDFKAIQYISLIPILIEGIQEQQNAIQSQGNKIDSLEKQIALLLVANINSTQTSPNNSNSSILNSHSNNGNSLADGDVSALFQNQPNPFKDNTTIQYYLTAKTQKASLIIFDMNGSLLKTIPINQFGKGSIEIIGGELKPGMFIYSLIADDKEVDSKRMILLN